MAEVHGKSAVFQVQDSGGTLRDLSSYLTSDGLSREADTPEVTAKGDNSKNYIAGLFDGSIPIEGNFDVVVDGYLAGILNVARTFEYYPAGTPVGATKPKYSGSVILTSYEVEAPVDDKVGFSGEFQITGDVVRAVA